MSFTNTLATLFWQQRITSLEFAHRQMMLDGLVEQLGGSIIMPSVRCEPCAPSPH